MYSSSARWSLRYDCVWFAATRISGCCVAAQPVHGELEYIKMRYRSPARSSFRDVLNTSTSTNSPSKQRPPLALQQPHSRRENQAYDTMNSSSTPTTTVTPVTVIEETKVHFHHDFPPPPSPLAKDQPDTALSTAFSIDGSIGTGTSLTTGTSAAADVSSTHALTEQQSASPAADSSYTRAHRATTSITPPAARTPSQTPVLAARDVIAGSPGGDLGYESYDSRRQLIVGQDVGQTMI